MEMDQHPNIQKTQSEDYEDDLLMQQSKSKKRSKRQAPYLIFPEILCIIDYDGYR